MQRDPAREFAWPVRVYYEDTDFGGVVYYARGAEPMAAALVQAACVRREDFKPAPIPAALAARLGA